MLRQSPWYAAAALSGLLLFSAPWLVVRDGRGVERAAFLVPRGRGFAITYRHSVTRQPCTEFFRRGRGNRMLLVATEFQGSGAGLPFTDEGGSATIRDGKMVIEGLARSFDVVRFAPLPMTEHRLRVGRRQYDLLGLVGGSGQAVLALARGDPARPAAALLRGIK